ncbi:nickel-dependent hydrogenase large subunit [Patescibacteria group bacterium]|nr:nickel-dependent hydrogenase large subunit [Patescibacteria group bacterium]MBU1870796.1 nickel-dependent hydrogenase large subunit [Patescibacteria group bacterium]
MHNNDLDINISKLSKIEGHTDLDIKIRNNKVEDVGLHVMENMRFFNQAVCGQSYSNAPQLVSRICGTCSIAHLTACIEAIEKALEIKPSEQTMILRKLTMYSMMIRDHALHLYFFVLPDIFNIDSALDMPKEKMNLIHEALHIKEAGNNLSNLIAGRAVHALFEQVGGFSNEIDKTKIPAIIKELKRIRSYVIKLAEIFYNCKWEFKRKTNFVALTTSDFSFLEGKIKSTNGAIIEEKDYWNHLHNVVLPYSQASGFEFEGSEYMVGALARLNLNKDALHSNTKKDMEKYLNVFPSDNVYHNNLAQVIEIMHSIDHSIELLEKLDFKKEAIVKPTKLSGEGVGVIEAARGTLYYWIGINEGKVRYANLVIPTAQNLINMRSDVRNIVSDICNDKVLIKKLENKIRKEVEKIIRAYDPCMSCAAHFLKINWK